MSPNITKSMKSNTRSDVMEEGIYNLDEIEEKVVTPNQWGSIGARTFKAFSVTHAELPAGCYSITLDNRDDSPIFIGKHLKTDQIIRFKGGMTDELLKDIDEFWKREDAFKRNGFLHRRGYLLYGSAGTGKSSIVSQVITDVINRGGVVLMCANPRFFMTGLKTYRQVEPRRPLVCVFEDIDAIIKKYDDTELLSILDGENQVDRVINIATTNFPELLSRRIVNRPRRFDRIYKIESPDRTIRQAFFKEKLPPEENAKEWLEKTEGLSFAAVTEALISVLCLGNSLDDTIKILKEIETKRPQSSDLGGSFGFGETDNAKKEKKGKDEEDDEL